jgi:hypothetical protein
LLPAANGTAFLKFATKYPIPSVILNNWIFGNPKKKFRAKKNKHWFFDEGTSKCLDPDPIRQNTFRATIVILTMDRVESLNRLLTSLVAANYSTPNTESRNDIRLVIRIDHPRKIVTDGFHRVVELANNFTHPAFSMISVDIQAVNKGLRSQWLTSLQDPRGWDEIGLILEDDLQVSPHFFPLLASPVVVSLGQPTCGFYLTATSDNQWIGAHTIMMLPLSTNTAHFCIASLEAGA